MTIPAPKVPLDAIKKAVASADAAAIDEWHQLAIDACHGAYGAMARLPTAYNRERYAQLLDLELAIIARGREVGVYPQDSLK